MSEPSKPANALSSSRPSAFEDRYRLYLDESGDHVYRKTEETAHRFLCLLGCWFRNPAYLEFHEALDGLKSKVSAKSPRRSRRTPSRRYGKCAPGVCRVEGCRYSPGMGRWSVGDHRGRR